MGEFDVRREVSDKYSLRGRVFHRIRDDILSGKYQEHEELKEVAIGEEMGVSREELYRGLLISNLVTLHAKTGIGRLSAYCGVVTAGAGAAADAAARRGAGAPGAGGLDALWGSAGGVLRRKRRLCPAPAGQGGAVAAAARCADCGLRPGYR